MAEIPYDQIREHPRALLKNLDALGWGIFLIWIGIAFLADVGWGVGLLGVGLIALGAQAARRYFGLPVERFGLLIGVVFVLWSAWELLKIQLGEAPFTGGLIPILFIAAGVALVASALLRKPRH